MRDLTEIQTLLLKHLWHHKCPYMQPNFQMNTLMHQWPFLRNTQKQITLT